MMKDFPERREQRNNLKLKVMAIVLLAAMTVPAAGCNKSKKKEGSDTSDSSSFTADDRTTDDFVKDTDPYFSDVTIDLQIPFEPDPNREVASKDANDARIGDNKIILSYCIEYKPTAEEQAMMDNISNYQDPSELVKFYEMTDARRENGLLLLDMQGNKLGKIKMKKFESVYSLQTLRNGRIGVMVSVFDTTDMNYRHKIVIMNDKGEREQEIDISDRENSWFYELSSGKFLLVDPSERELIVVDGQGYSSSPAKFSDEFEQFFEIGGKGYIKTEQAEYLEEESIFHHFLTEVDLENCTVGTAKELDGESFYRYLECNGKYYADDDEGTLFLCDIANGTREAVYHPEDMDTLILGLTDLEITPEGEIYVLQTTRSGLGELQETSFALTHLHKEAVNPHAGKRIVRATSCSTGLTEIRRMAAAYNKQPGSKARVLAFVEKQDLSLGFDKAEANAADSLLLSMKSGEGPDVIIDCAEYSQFNSEDILVDLNTYMDGSNGIDRSLYYDNVFRAFEANGKLFQMPVTFSMVGFNGNKKVLGDIDTWDPVLFEQKIDALGNGVYPAAGHFMNNLYVQESKGLFSGFLYCDMDHYVDYSKREAHFDTDDFRKILELSKKYGDRITGDKLQALYEQYDDMMSDHTPDALMMQDGVIALSPVYVANLREFAAVCDVCGNDPLFIGWPTSRDSGMTAIADISVGMSSFSECKDEAWDFIRFLIQPEGQTVLDDDVNNIFVLRSCEEADMKKEIETYQKKMQEMQEVIHDPVMLNAVSVVDDAAAKRFDAFIGKVHSSVNTNPKIMEIVLEEAEGFFKGQKSADEVSKTLQNRITTYLAETK